MSKVKASRKSAVTQPKNEVLITRDGYAFGGKLGKRVKAFCDRSGMTPDELLEAALEAEIAKSAHLAGVGRAIRFREVATYYEGSGEKERIMFDPRDNVYVLQYGNKDGMFTKSRVITLGEAFDWWNKRRFTADEKVGGMLTESGGYRDMCEGISTALKGGAQ